MERTECRDSQGLFSCSYSTLCSLQRGNQALRRNLGSHGAAAERQACSGKWVRSWSLCSWHTCKELTGLSSLVKAGEIEKRFQHCSVGAEEGRRAWCCWRGLTPGPGVVSGRRQQKTKCRLPGVRSRDAVAPLLQLGSRHVGTAARRNQGWRGSGWELSGLPHYPGPTSTCGTLQPHHWEHAPTAKDS